MLSCELTAPHTMYIGAFTCLLFYMLYTRTDTSHSLIYHTSYFKLTMVLAVLNLYVDKPFVNQYMQ